MSGTELVENDVQVGRQQALRLLFVSFLLRKGFRKRKRDETKEGPQGSMWMRAGAREGEREKERFRLRRDAHFRAAVHEKVKN